ncbi:DUF927 domain-containing protein [Nocardiopsis alba]|uniref:DUF927 domain-containing protein n=1 Tax=Nocardiopsis alba TaxID=53437 RepID=UPI00366BC7D5
MTETSHTPTPTGDPDEGQGHNIPPAHRIPMSSGSWRYSLGDDGHERGVYMKGQGKNARWEYVSPLPHITTRLTDRDGEGARTNLRYRLTMDLDAPASTATVCDRRDITTGEWAVRLDVPVSADRRILDAAATAIFSASHHEGVDVAESVPMWRDGHLIMPPADMGPEGYQEYAADEERALTAWREIARVCADNPKLGLCLGAAVGGLYVGPLDRQPFIVDLVGAARRGKSTGLFLGAGALGWAGSPRQPSGVLRTANSSAQGMHQMLRALACLPAFADETGTAKRTVAQKEEFILSIAQGDSRTMGERGGLGGKRTPRWSGVYMASGNESIGEGVTNEATWARVMAVHTPITATPAAAARISELVPLAYGWPFQWVLRDPDIDGMAARLATAENDMPIPAGGGVPGTIAENLALIVAGARLVGDMIGVTDWTGPVLDEARSILTNMTAELDERGATPADRLMSAVLSAWSTHPDTFPDLATYKAAFTKTPLPGEVYPPRMPPVVDGLVLDEPPALAVWPGRMGSVAREADISDHNAGLRDLVAEGRMITNPGRRQKKVSITTDMKRWMYLFRLDEEATPADDGPGPDDQSPPETDGTSANTRTGAPADETPAEVPTEEQPALMDEAGQVPTDPTDEVPTTEVPSSHSEVPTEVPSSQPPTGNLGEPVLTWENTGSQDRSSQSSQFPKTKVRKGVGTGVGTEVPTGNSGGNRSGNRGPRPKKTTPAPAPAPARPEVLALALEGATGTLYTYDRSGIHMSDAGTLMSDMGRLLNYCAEVMPTGGTIAVDAEAGASLGYPDYPERFGDTPPAELPMPDRPRVVADAALESWIVGSAGTDNWTTWTRGESKHPDQVAITVAALEWMDARLSGVTAHPMLTMHMPEGGSEGDEVADTAADAVYLLGRVRELTGTPWAYTGGSTWCMGIRDQYLTRAGLRRPDLEKKVKEPKFKLHGRHYDGPLSPAYDVVDPALRWRDPSALEGGDHTRRWVIGYDMNMAHLGIAASAALAVNAVRELDDVEWDRGVHGLWLMDPVNDAYGDGQGPPLAGPAASTTGPWWAHTVQVDALIKWGIVNDGFSTRAVVPVDWNGDPISGETQIFRGYATRLRDAIQSIPKNTQDELESRVRKALTSQYSEAAGQMSRIDSPWLSRPDWSMAITSGARVNTLRTVVKIYDATGKWPIEIASDAIYYETDGPDPKKNNPAPGIIKFDETELKLGHYKCIQNGTMAEYIEKRSKVWKG